MHCDECGKPIEAKAGSYVRIEVAGSIAAAILCSWSCVSVHAAHRRLQDRLGGLPQGGPPPKPPALIVESRADSRLAGN